MEKDSLCEHVSFEQILNDRLGFSSKLVIDDGQLLAPAKKLTHLVGAKTESPKNFLQTALIRTSVGHYRLTFLQMDYVYKNY